MLFLARGKGHTLFLTADETVLALRKPGHSPRQNLRGRRSPGKKLEIGPVQLSVLRMQLIGANLHGRIVGMEPMEGKVNCFHGNNPAKWRTAKSLSAI